jgi:hypothetical protein
MTTSKFVKSALTLCAGLVALSACSKEEAQKAADQIGNGAGKAVTELKLDDQWGTACLDTPVLLKFLGLPKYTEQYDIGASFNKTTVVFGDANCATPAIRYTEHGTYDGLETKIGDSARAINFHYETVKITPLSAEGVTKLNATLTCARTSWALNVEQDVTAQSPTAVPPCWTATPRITYDIVNVNGDQVKFGKVDGGLDKTAAEKRPTVLDESYIYNRQ